MKTPHLIPSLLMPLTACALMPASLMAAEPQTGSGETDGYSLVWQDLFDDGELNRDRWNVEVNGDGGGNNELQYYRDSEDNIRVGEDSKGNGCLIITARRESYLGKSFTSGRVNSMHKVAFTHGKIEAAIRFPSTANGLWPAFWMMGNDYSQVGWPKSGETDIVEMGHQNAFGTGYQDRYFNGAMHWGQGWPNASHAMDATKSYSLQDGEFHLFTCIWDSDEVRMYVDLDKHPRQTPYFKMTIPANEPDNEWSPGNYFHKDNFILFNMAIGGGFPGIYDPAGITALNDDNGQQASMYVNYVKIYQKGTPDENLMTIVDGDNLQTSVSAVACGDNTRISLSDGAASAPGSLLSVTAADGRLLREGADRVDLSSLPSGMVIITARNAEGFRTSVKTILNH